MTWLTKLAASAPVSPQDGHWRNLPPGQTGSDQAGNPLMGRTWVRKSRMKPGMNPMPHQSDFIHAAGDVLGRREGGGIIAAHGTGTGKTYTAIATFENLKQQGKAKRALVVTPAGLRNNFLVSGVGTFTDSKGVIASKPQSVPDDVEYVVASYDAFRRDPQKWLDDVKPDVIIADELHKAANPGSANFQSLLYARQRTPRFIGLTASVSQNHPSDVAPLLELAYGDKPPYTGKQQFNAKHIEQRVAEGSRGIFGGKVYEKRLINQLELNTRVGAAIHYVEDLDASKKPTKEVTTVDVPMSAEQIGLYRDAMRGVDPVILKKIKEGEPVSQKQAMNVFMRLMRARQVSNSMQIAVPNMTPAQAAERTPKIKRVLDEAEQHLKDTPDGQIVMFTNFVHGGVDTLQAGLEARGIEYGVFAGRGVPGVTEETRQQAVDDYKASKKRVIIITGAGAEGLSLGNTTMVQMVDGHYNPERIAQAEARGVRAGGLSHRPQKDRKVQVRRYVSVLPKTFWQNVTFRPADRSVEQYVYLTADKKDHLNRELRDVLRERTEENTRRRESTLYRLLH